MTKFKQPYKKLLIAFIIFALLFPTIIITSDSLPITNVEAANDMNKDDQKIAEDISNMTGAKTEEVIKLKNEGLTWNDVLDKLKKIDYSNHNDRDTRSTVLAENGLDEDFVKKLKSESYTDGEITEAKMLVERVIFQLSEITAVQDESELQPVFPTTGMDKQDEDDISKYTELSGKIVVKTAVELMLKLKKDFGSLEGVLDEYLYTLQVDADLMKYLEGKEVYEKEKTEKEAGKDLQKLITMAKIEEKMLQRIQDDNKKSTNINDSAGIENNEIPGIKDEDRIPKSPLPEVEDTRPENPADEVMKEINDIKSSSLGMNVTDEGGK